MKHVGYLVGIAWPALLIRDVMFRQIMLTVYYLTTDVEHQPMLKYTMPQIADFMK